MSEKNYAYHLPSHEDSAPIVYETPTNSIIIIGANGSGKSRLGAWMEAQDRVNYHRIGAQRSIGWTEVLAPKSLELLQNIILYGQSDINEKNARIHFANWKDGKTTTERNDIDAVLSAIFAKRTLQLEDFDDRFKNDGALIRERNIVDDITTIWEEVFPHRKIRFKDMNVLATIETNISGTNTYNGIEMSDGERVALYLIAQALLIPANRKIIIDEPEIHLHRSIMNPLWLTIEQHRPDCLFIYITHDTQFAANHIHSDKVWVKGYDGGTYKWEHIKPMEFPEQLLLDILGNRKPVIFVEGTSDSCDIQLYAAIYKDYYIIPCGSCEEVILRTKAFRRLQDEPSQLHHVDAYGIIDRDFRTEAEVAALKKDHIYTLRVAEVENLFLVEELLDFINTHQGFPDKTRIEQAKEYVINQKFCNQLDSQIWKATIAEIKHGLSTIDISKKQDGIEASLKDALKTIDHNAISDTCAAQYRDAAEKKDYKQILKLFNSKDIGKKIGDYFGVKNNGYCNLVLRLINGEHNADIVKALSAYLPTNEEIPMNPKPGGSV